MLSDDETQQSTNARSTGVRRGPRAWMRWIVDATSRPSDPKRHPGAASAAQLDVHTALRLLPTLLDSSSLPNGVVELLIEDFEAPTRQLFDIHDGCITLVQPGAAVPWASIAGTPTAWTLALGPKRNTAELHLTGDEQLARRVLAAFPQSV
ncbi:MAG: hypothetical protein WAN93_03560 [Solirubrobacteraceae bacterium]